MAEYTCPLQQTANMFKALLVLCFAGVVFAQYGHHEEHHEEHFKGFHAKPKYKFEYDVEDKHNHDYKEHKESRDGDKVKGYYSLHEPDGTIRIVHYEADHKTGFNAHVERKGKATHPVIHSNKETFFKHHHEHHDDHHHDSHY